jgi:hypothetical protein
MSGPELCAGADSEGNVSLPARRFSDVFSLIDNGDDAIRSAREEVVSHLAEYRFRQAVFKMHAAMRVDEVIGIVVTE